MKHYLVCVWEDGKKWCQVIGTTDIVGMTRFYKNNYDRFTIQERDYGNTYRAASSKDGDRTPKERKRRAA